MKMKRILVSVLVLALLFCGCSMKQAQEEQKNWTTYVINDETCRAVYSAPPEEAVTKISKSEWVGGHYRDASVDEEGNFVLTLSEDDIAHWKKEMERNLEMLVNSASKDNDGGYLKISDDYHQLISKVQEENALAAGIEMQMAQIWCATMQMLNGEDPNEWWVDIKYIDLESGNTVFECKDFPRTCRGYEITPEDWEKAREGKQ